MKSVEFEVLLLNKTGKSKQVSSVNSMEAAQRFINRWKEKHPDDQLVINCLWSDTNCVQNNV